MFKNSKSKRTYSIRKYSVGVASVLVGMTTLLTSQVALADEETAEASLADSDNPQVTTTASVPRTTVAMEGLSLAETAPVQAGSDLVTQVESEDKSTPEVMTNASDSNGSTYDLDHQGAQLAYTSYQAEEAALTGGATVVHSTDMASTAVEASQQTYVELSPKESAVTIQVAEPADALNLRYTIPDGAEGQLDVQVNGGSVGQLDLSSNSSWQYLKGDHEYDQDIEGASARFRFDETRLLLKDIQLKTGDKLSLVKKNDDQVPYGIDLIELEQAAAPLAQPENSINILAKGASANDDQDDTAALLAAVEEAKATGQAIYIPEGRFNFDRQVNIEADNLKISGAGIWHSQLHFTSDQRYGGGIVFGHKSNGIELSHLYMDSNLTSRYNEDAQYKAISGTLGKDSKIHDVWIQHFEVGMWIGDYDQTGDMRYTDGLLVENARIRNNLADGINFAQGTKNSIVKNSHIRGNGDDGLASWSSISQGTNAAIAENNKFLNNTIELGWRAAGIGIFGGKGHEIAGNLIKDTFAGAGIRVNTVFAGHHFDLNDTGIRIHDNVLLRTGTADDLYQQERGALDFQEVRGEIKQVTVSDNKFLNNLISTAITSTRPLGDNGNADIRLVNNVIDNKAVILGEGANQSTAILTSETTSSEQVSKPSTSEVLSPLGRSHEPVSETVASEAGVASEVVTVSLTSETVVSESQASEIASSEAVSESQTSEAVTSELVSEVQPSDVVSSEAISENQTSEAVTSEAVSENQSSEAVPGEVVLENQVSESVTSEVVSENPMSETASSEAVSENQVSESVTSEVVSENQLSDTASSEVVSEVQLSDEVSSEAVSENQSSEAVTSEAVSESQSSEAVPGEVVSENQSSEVVTSEGVSETTVSNDLGSEASSKHADQGSSEPSPSLSDSHQSSSEAVILDQGSTEPMTHSEEEAGSQTSESQAEQVASLGTSTSHISVVVASETSETTASSETVTVVDPISQVGSENLSEGFTHPLVIKESSESPAEQAHYQRMSSSQNNPTASLMLSWYSESFLETLVSDLMTTLVSETMSPALAAIATMENPKEERVDSAESKTDHDATASSEKQPSSSTEKAESAHANQESKERTQTKSNHLPAVLALVGVLGASILSLAYVRGQRQKVHKQD